MPGKLQLLTAPQGPGCVVTILYREGITALSKTTPGPDTTSDCCLSHCCKLWAKLIGHKAQAVDYIGPTSCLEPMVWVCTELVHSWHKLQCSVSKGTVAMNSTGLGTLL